MAVKIRWLGICILLTLLLSSFTVILTEKAQTDDQAQWYSQYTQIIVDKNGQRLEIDSTPLKPPQVKMEAAELPEPDPGGAAGTLTSVPAFTWVYGCSATSAGMMAGYYDQPSRGYTNMYAGPTNGGVCPMNNEIYWGHTVYPGATCGECPLVATHQGYDGLAVKGHVDDFWYDYLSNVDPYSGNWTQHVYADCTADYMGTNQYINWHNTDGSTTFFYVGGNAPLYDYSGAEPSQRDGCHGMKLFFESRGYTVTSNYNQRIYGYDGISAGFTYNDFKAQINASRPVLIQLAGHTVLGYGYSDPDTIAIHDTWDNLDHTMTWGSTYAGLQHRGVTVIELAALDYTLNISSSSGGTVTTPGVGSFGPYTDGQIVNISATPNPCYRFVNWTGNITTIANASAPSTTITMNGNYSITANFALTGETYTLTYNASAGGSINGSMLQTVDCGANGAPVTAVPDTCYHFVNWSDSKTNNPRTDTNVISNITVTASFAINTYTINSSAGTNGNISPSGDVTVNCGADQVFNITPDACAHIIDVLVDGGSVGALATYNFTSVTASHNISASFAIDTYTINATAGTNGNISPSGDVTVNCGANQVFNITPDACYRVADVLVDGGSVGALTTYNFTSVTASHNISTSFAKVDTYTINATAGANGNISPSGDVTVNCGANQVFNITPDAYYHITTLTVDGAFVQGLPVESYTFTNVIANHNISATFSIDTFTLSMTADPPAGGSPAGSGTYDHGSNVAIHANTNPYYVFAGWTPADGIDNASAEDSTVSMTKNRDLTAHYTLTPVPNAPPSNLVATAVSSSQINLTWQDNSNNEIGFKIERKTGLGGTYSQIATVGANVTVYSSTRLTANTTYCYRVRSYNAAWNSNYSAEASAKTLPLPPPVPALKSPASRATGMNLTPRLAWNPSTGAVNYSIQVSNVSTFATTVISQVGMTNTYFDVPGGMLAWNMRYYWRVNAVGPSGSTSAWSNARYFTTGLGPPPADPSSLAATAISSSQINLNWQDNSNNETGFKLERKTGVSGTYSQIATVGVNVVSYSNTGLTASTTYYYRVRSYSAAGNSNYSAEVSAKTLPLPPLVPVLTLPASGAIGLNQTPRLVWKLSTTGAVNYSVQVSTVSAFGTTVVNQSGVSVNYSDVPGGTLAWNTRYYWRVNAVGPSGSTSAWSNARYFTTGLGPPPADPSSLAATAVLSSQINLNWQDNSNNETGFKIERKTGASGTYSQIATVGVNVMSYSNTGLTANTTYYYQVRSYSAAGNSNYSVEASVKTLPLPPPVPVLTSPASRATGLNLTPRLAWNPSTGAVNYSIQVSTVSTFATTVANQSGVSFNYFDVPGGTLAWNTRYYWRVNAVGVSSSTSAWSTAKYFNTKTGP